MSDDSGTPNSSESDTLATILIGPYMNEDWRAPNTSEAEQISEWMHKDFRARRPAIYMFLIFFALSILIIILPFVIQFRGSGPKIVLGVSGGIMFLISAFFLFYLIFFCDIYRNSQIRRGDYQILDSVVMNALIQPDGSFIVNLKIASGESADIRVNESEFYTITTGTPGFLLRYGKNTSQKIVRTTPFIPARETAAQSDSPENQSSFMDWRSPDSSEADRIAAWADKMTRADLTNIIGVWVLISLCLVGLMIMYNDPIMVTFIFVVLIFITMTLTQVRAGLIVLRLKKQVSGIDYLISDAVVVTKVTQGRRRSSDSKYYMQVKTPSGEMISLKVAKALYDAVTENTPGFLVRFGKDEPIYYRGNDKAFCPAIPAEK